MIEQFNIKLMQEKGFKLTAEDIYSVNKACMKDAVIHAGGGCTAEPDLSEGLLITNHHRGYSRIQAHSTLEHDWDSSRWVLGNVTGGGAAEPRTLGHFSLKRTKR
ncbi:MAG: S46 family peptidase [Bacteroidales bacterium]